MSACTFPAAIARGREASRAFEDCLCVDDEGLTVLPCSCSRWAAEALADIIAAAPVWVPCSEQMPEPWAEVLAVIRDAPASGYSPVYVLCYRPDRPYTAWEGPDIYLSAEHVSHWMPLPELPA